MMEHARVGMILADARGRVVESNAAAWSLLGLTRDQLEHSELRPPSWSVVDGSNRVLNDSLFPIARALRLGVSIRNLLIGVDRPSTGDRVWLLCDAEVQRDACGLTDGIVCTFSDVTRERRAEERARQSEEHHRSVLSAMAEGVVMQDASGRIITCSDRAPEILGMTHSEMMGRASRDPRWKAIREDRSPFPGDEHPAMVTLRTGQPQNNVIMGLQGDGTEPTWISINSRPLFHTGESEPYAVVSSFSDITRVRRAERELIRAQRLGALGEMAGGISHNLNNLLMGVLGPTQILLKELGDGDVRNQVRAIQLAAVRARDLVRRLNRGLRMEAEPLDDVHVAQLFDEALQTTRPRWHDEALAFGKRIEVSSRCPDDLHVRATSSGLVDALINLILNAVDALPDGGAVALEAARTEDGRVEILVSDNGTGMDEDTASRVFEPFFTTKSNVGTGLGLSTVYGAVRRWGGSVDVSSEAGRGTTFRLVLGLGTGVTPQSTAPMVRPSAVRGRILMVEDDEAVGRVMNRVLADRHDVTWRRSPGEAQEVFAPGRFDVVIADLSLPGEPGDRLVRDLCEQDPVLGSLLMSGLHLEDGDPRLEGVGGFLAKPFVDLDALATRVEEQLARVRVRARDLRRAGCSASASRP